MSRRPHLSLFETTSSALHLPARPAAGGPDGSSAVVDSHNSSLDKSFWVLRELGRHLAVAPATPPPVPPDYRRDGGRMSA